MQITCAVNVLLLFYYFLSVGTETAITFFELVSSGVDFITVEWSKPKYTPISLEYKVLCGFECDERLHLKTSGNLSKNTTRLVVTDLKPNSMCKIILLALYNPETYDHGLVRYYSTLSSSKRNFYIH